MTYPRPDSLEDRIAACTRRLEARCEADDVFITGDGRVRADIAAELLGFSVGTLANWRTQQKGPTANRREGVITYRLDALAAWIEEGFDL